MSQNNMFSKGLDNWIKRKTFNTPDLSPSNSTVKENSSKTTPLHPESDKLYKNSHENIDQDFDFKVSPKPKKSKTVKNLSCEDSEMNQRPKKKMKKPKTDDCISPTIDSENENKLTLTGKKCVLTGLFESCTKEEMMDHIKKLGGTCTTAVSGLTDYLITGKILEDNRPIEDGRKYKKAIQLQKEGGRRSKIIEIVNEADFLKLYPTILTMLNNPQLNAENETNKSKNEILKSEEMKPTKSVFKIIKSEEIQKESHQSNDINMWINKWKPSDISQIIGNDDIVKKLIYYLENWHDLCILKKPSHFPKTTKSSRYTETEKVNSKAVLLSGPPGIGKTTTAKLCASHCNYNIIEFNASDDRGNSVIKIISDMTNGGCSLDSFVDSQKSCKKSLIIMDEMDGLSKGDRGGVAALIKLIETTRCPVVCICNDRYNPKLRSLVNKCYDLQCRRPSKSLISKYLYSMLQKENIAAEYNAIELISERSGNDLRQIINFLQILSQNKTAITYELAKQELNKSLKDLQVMDTAFDVVRKLLNQNKSSEMSFNDMLYGYFTDYDLIPLMVAENYLMSYHNRVKTQQNNKDLFAPIVEASRCISFSDILNRKCRKDGHWSLLSDIGLYSVLIPSKTLSGFIPYPAFPAWLGKNSTTSKNKRLLYELQINMTKTSSISPSAMQLSGYLDLIHLKTCNLLLEPTQEKLQDNIQRAVDILFFYKLTKEHFSDYLPSLKFKSQNNLYEKVDSRIKRTFTTALNAKKTNQFSLKKSKFENGAKNSVEDIMDHHAPIKEPVEATESTDEESSNVDHLIKVRKPRIKKTQKK